MVTLLAILAYGVVWLAGVVAVHYLFTLFFTVLAWCARRRGNK